MNRKPIYAELYENVQDIPNLNEGDLVLMYVRRGEGGSSMGRGTEGIDENLMWMHWCWPIYSGKMGCVKYPDGKALGIPISVNDIFDHIKRK